MNDAKQRTKRPVSSERIFDVMVDIRIRSRRGADDSVSTVLRDHSIDPALAISLEEVGYLSRKGRDYIYSGEIATIDLAEKALELYNERKRPAPSSSPELFEEKPNAIQLENETVGEMIRLLRMNASTLADINKRLTRLETKQHVQGETVEQLASDLKLAIYQPENMRVIQNRNAANG